MKYAIQMYLFRHKAFTKKQKLAVLRRVAEMGWDGIELFNCTDLDPDEIKRAVGNCEILNPMLWHANFDEKHIDRTISWLKKLNASTAAFSSIPVLHPDDKVYREYNPKYISIAKKMAENGLLFCHHNHTDEFKMYDGQFGIDFLLKDVSPYCLEIDTYWAEKTGVDVVHLMEDRKNTLKYVHIKDKKDSAKKFCAIGDGDVDNRTYCAKAKELGLEYITVDLDNSDIDAFESARRSLAWLKANI